MSEILQTVKEWSPVVGVVLGALAGHLTLKLDKKLSDFREDLRKEFVSQKDFATHQANVDKRMEDMKGAEREKIDQLIDMVGKMGGGGKTFVWSPPPKHS